MAAAAAVLFTGMLWQLVSPAQAGRAAAPTMAAHATPAYTAQGELVFPADYREWVFLTSGLDMSYREDGTPEHSMFDNVFVNLSAYRSFMATGTWPEQTMIVKEDRGAAGKGSINVAGHFQSGGPMGAEVHVKDSRRFPGGWAFFAFSGTAPAPQIPQAASCYSCHAQHGAVDTTFVQFYPTLLPAASAHGTVKPEK